MSRRVLRLKINRSNFELLYSEIMKKLSFIDTKIRIYIDTNIFGRAIDGKMDQTNTESIERIVSKKNISLYTSEKTRQEIKNNPNKGAQSYLQFIVNLVTVIPEEHFIKETSVSIGEATLGSVTIGGTTTQEDKTFTQLSVIFQQDDAEHIFQAIKSNAQYFITLDQKTIINKRDEYNKLGYQTRLVTPLDLEKILFAIEDNS
ncbi:MAG: hypothetical protein JWN37_780 [Candidatus Nomurabacteria bacterium]|nr:hypothetical protein [Candidatus Nomurabacteria bacterium]